MELDLQSFFGPCVELYLLAETPQPSHSPAFGLVIEGASQETSLCNPLL